MATTHASNAFGRDEVMGELLALAGLAVLAALGHIVLFTAFYLIPALFGMFAPPPQDFETIEVSLISEAHIDAAMTQMATHTAQPEAPTDLEAPDPVEDAGAADQGTAEAEEVPNPSDLEFKTEDAEEVKGDPTNTQQDQDAEKRKRDLLRQAMLDSQLGTENNQAGDPDSTTSDRINLGGNGISDPEAARYIDRCRKQVYENFNPLPQLRNADPPFSAKIRVRFDVDTGEVQSWSWVTRSGNASWDGAAERAVESVGRFPPPPAHLQDLFRQGFVFNLTVE